MNRALHRISLACLVMFVLLLINVNYVQAFESTSLAGKPGNVRTFDQQFQYQRGSIVAAGDLGHPVTIAESRLVKGTTTYRRYYPFGQQYAAVTGYDSVYGATGIEYYEDKELAGTDSRLAVHNLLGLFNGKSKVGATVNLTISARAQQAAYRALAAQAAADGGKPAALVALDPSSGAILAVATWPTYNPNELTTFSGSQLNKTDRRLLRAPGQPLLNRALLETYPPGSSFKIVTGSAWLSGGAGRSQNSTVSAPTVLTLPNRNLLHNDGDEACGDGQPMLIQAFYLSCNTAFGKLGINVGAQALLSQAGLFGWNKGLSTPLPVVASRYPLESDASLRALSAIGQLNDEVTPMQEAMDAAAIANGGTLMTPLPGAVGPGAHAQPQQDPDREPEGPVPCREPEGGDLDGPDDARGDPEPRRHGLPDRRAAGRGQPADCRQDRHRGERRQQRGARRCGLHLFRAVQQPADSRRRHSPGRRFRRRRCRADRREGHPGIPGGVMSTRQRARQTRGRLTAKFMTIHTERLAASSSRLACQSGPSRCRTVT